MKKLTLVSIIVRNVRYSCFVTCDSPIDSPIRIVDLHDIFPILSTIERGETITIG